MEKQDHAALINKYSLKPGLLLSFVSIIVSVVFLVIDPLLMYTTFWAPLLSFVIIVVLMIVLGLDVRKKIGNYWSLGEAFRSLIIMSVLLVVTSTVYNFVVFKFVEPDLPAKVSSVMLENMTAKFSKAGIDQEKIDNYTKQFSDGEFEEKMKPTVKNELIAIAVGLLVDGVISLIIAACIKRKALLLPSDDGSYSTTQAR